MIHSFTKNAVLATVIGSVAIVTFQPAVAQTKSKIQPVIQTSYNQINAAFIRKDIKGATAYFTPDYVSINPKGEKQTLEEFRTHYDNLFNRFNIKLTSNKATIKNIIVNADGIDVAIEQRTEGTIAGINKIVINQTSSDLWMKTPQGWRLKQSKILTNQTTFNGKTFNS
jgi:ketosteroid isomerase-like protein